MEGVTRIDTVLTNFCASHSCLKFWYDWEQAKGYDHVALCMDIDRRRFHEDITGVVPPCRLNLPAKPFGKARAVLHAALQGKFEVLWEELVAHAFDLAEAELNLEQTHHLWNIACETFLLRLCSGDWQAELRLR